jgi:hypothetical protein
MSIQDSPGVPMPDPPPHPAVMATMAAAATPSPVMPWYVVPGLAYIITIAFIAITTVIVVRGENSNENLVLGALITLVTGSTGFYFGNSMGSQKKDEQNAAAMQALANSTPIGGQPNA